MAKICDRCGKSADGGFSFFNERLTYHFSKSIDYPPKYKDICHNCMKKLVIELKDALDRWSKEI